MSATLHSTYRPLLLSKEEGQKPLDYNISAKTQFLIIPTITNMIKIQLLLIQRSINQNQKELIFPPKQDALVVVGQTNQH